MRRRPPRRVRLLRPPWRARDDDSPIEAEDPFDEREIEIGAGADKEALTDGG